MSSVRPGVTKRACDGCKIRKIRCGGGQPCRSCTKAGIKCTYVRVQQCRGPRRLRSTTQLLIEKAQSDAQSHACEASHPPNDLDEHTMPLRQSADLKCSRIPIDVLTSPLSIYHVRMYPVWPIVNVEEIVSALQQDVTYQENEAYALATAVAAATIAQLRLEQVSGVGEAITADRLAAECLRSRDLCGYRSRASLNSIRTSFFLHVYYENQNSGGSEALLYLREAISLAQMMGLHREASYNSLSFELRQLCRRVLWLLFVTERGVCILHRFPVALKTNISPPEIDEHDESQVLPAFIKLLNLFQMFEKSGMFDIIQDEHSDPARAGHVNWPFLERLQQNLQDGSMVFDHVSDVQKADLCVTRHWMRMILWKLSPNKCLASSPPADATISVGFPVMVAKELVGIVSQLPRSAVEAHGLGMELKIYEIANSLADAITDLTGLPHTPEWQGDNRPNYILHRLHSILSTFRGGGNKKLVDVLYRKMAEAQLLVEPVLPTPLRSRTKRRRVSSREREARDNDRQGSGIPEHDPVLSVSEDLTTYPFDRDGACELPLGSQSGAQYLNPNEPSQPTYDELTSDFLFDPSSVAIASENMVMDSPFLDSPFLSSFMPINTVDEDLSSQILWSSTQDFIFPGADFTTFATNSESVGLH
ncbi:Zn(II)2Cys6 transcription factor [Aspergillus alliaceus]|uniref:Zn(II)2Cys6 transcription factor n=1 Tax=Petromyces alliaceus TaxID=209559 RepID=UPI0012A3E012|nr:fungal-specific transcription factor domain-containing protein [Aspergillus alliaceus]KAB8235690.1 fungal-specific transcription factor domain-containing protein [Aspergillus alliaceus]